MKISKIALSITFFSFVSLHASEEQKALLLPETQSNQQQINAVPATDPLTLASLDQRITKLDNTTCRSGCIILSATFFMSTLYFWINLSSIANLQQNSFTKVDGKDLEKQTEQSLNALQPCAQLDGIDVYDAQGNLLRSIEYQRDSAPYDMSENALQKTAQKLSNNSYISVRTRPVIGRGLIPDVPVRPVQYIGCGNTDCLYVVKDPKENLCSDRIDFLACCVINAASNSTTLSNGTLKDALKQKTRHQKEQQNHSKNSGNKIRNIFKNKHTGR